MPIKIIAAVATNGVIGHEGGIPWEIKGDLKRFKDITMGHPVVMGRKTWESIPEKYRPLPGRENIILSQSENKDDLFKGATVLNVWSKIFDQASKQDLFIIGGSKVYELALTTASDFHLTEVCGEPKGDAFFPDWNRDEWEVVEEIVSPPDDSSTYPWIYRHLKHI